MNNKAIFAMIGSAWILASCGGGHHHAREAVELPSVTVRTAPVESAEWPSVYEAMGTVTARTTATISAKVMGYVQEVKVDAGDRVRAGQTLITLDARDLEANYRQAQAGLNEAKSAATEVENAIQASQAQLGLAEATFKRMKNLFDKRSISAQEFDEVSAKLEMAKANHQMALSKRAQLAEKIQQAEQAVEAASVFKSYTEITAPFAGTVTNKMVDPGNLTAPGAPLLTIERDGAFRLEAKVEESKLPSVRAGQEVQVELDAVGKTVDARISEVIPAVDAASRAFIVRIDLPAVSGLRSGIFGRAKLATATKTVVAAPADAVVRKGQVLSVYVVEDGRARNRLVTLGEQRDGMVEVLSGLTPGEQVVISLPSALVDGSPVEVRP